MAARRQIQKDELSYSYRALGGVGSMNQILKVQDGGKSQHAKQSGCKQCAQCKVVKELDKGFHKMRLGQGGECNACKGGS